MMKLRQLSAMALLAPLAAVAAVAAVGGCNRDEQVRVYDVPKQPPGANQVAGTGGPTTSPAADPHGGRSAEELRRMMAARQAGSAQPQGESVIGWTVPAGWEELQTQAGDMRHAAFAVVPDRMDVLVTVTPLGPSDTLANVNRWLGQLGAQPITAAQLPQVVSGHDVNGSPVEEVDLSGPAGDKQQRMLAAIVKRPDRYWFVKLMGPPDLVGAQKEKFDQFVHSIRFTNVPAAAPDGATAAQAQAPAPPAADPGAPAGVQISKYDAPPGWQPQPIPPGSMFPRELSFKVGEGNEAADVAVTKLRAGATGTPLDNVNRWRGQVGLPPLTQLGDNDLQAQAVNGQPWLTLDVTGPDANGQPARRMLVAFTERGGEVWFVKLLGPAAAVGAQQQNFGQFLRSLQFGGN
jgi:hypothetical protein